MEERGQNARKTHIPNDTQGPMPQQYFVTLERVELIKGKLAFSYSCHTYCHMTSCR